MQRLTTTLALAVAIFTVAASITSVPVSAQYGATSNTTTFGADANLVRTGELSSVSIVSFSLLAIVLISGIVISMNRSQSRIQR